mgnify:CR=1 FL=1
MRLIALCLVLTGCLHEGQPASLYCDDVHIATSEKGFVTYDNYYKYKVDGQIYRYTAVEGSTCKIVEIKN